MDETAPLKMKNTWSEYDDDDVSYTAQSLHAIVACTLTFSQHNIFDSEKLLEMFLMLLTG